jgi:glycosyltransferase involved in cell wall biosynthesis
MNVRIQSVAVAIITCNRPEGLEKLLSALMQLEFPHFPAIELNILVVENGKKLKAEAQVERYRAKGLDVIYAHEPKPGLSTARNCAIDLAMECSDYFAFIDDDEYPQPDWLDCLLCCSKQYESPVVHGPVIPLFPLGAPSWGERGGFFLRGRYPTGTETTYCSTSNVLIQSKFLRESAVRFDDHFTLTGGEDTMFFMQLREQTSVKIVWCDEAIVMEDIPADRVSVAWIIRRATREGANMPHYDVILGRARFYRLRWIFHGVMHLILALPLWGIGLFQGEIQRIRSRRKFALGVGMIRGSFGHTINEYQERHEK